MDIHKGNVARHIIRWILVLSCLLAATAGALAGKFPANPRSNP